MTPSLPTFSIASARILPICLSPLEAIVATCSIRVRSLTGRDISLISATAAFTASSIPRLSSIGGIPAARSLIPSRTIARASTVAVVVPSPATSEVFCATSRISFAPRFSNLLSSSISLTTVTPSFVTSGAPKLLWIITLRPLGPSVTRAASATKVAPAIIPALARS